MRSGGKADRLIRVWYFGRARWYHGPRGRSGDKTSEMVN